MRRYYNDAPQLIYKYSLQIQDTLNMYRISTEKQLAEKMITDYMLKRVITSLIASIGELTKYIPEGFKQEHNHINWNALYRSRNIISHAYDITKDEILARIVFKNNANIIQAMFLLLRK